MDVKCKHECVGSMVPASPQTKNAHNPVNTTMIPLSKDVTKLHNAECPKYPVTCFNGCGLNNKKRMVISVRSCSW